ncbi:MAG: dihydroxy-acid dehydratase, partial [Nitrososphaerota archaeon]
MLNLKRRSNLVVEGVERSPHRALLRALGLSDEELSRPFIGIANSWNEVVPGHIHLDKLSCKVKDGVRSRNGVPLEFNT